MPSDPNLVRSGNEFSIDAVTQISLPPFFCGLIFIWASHTYELGTLESGTYRFVVETHGNEVQEKSFTKLHGDADGNGVIDVADLRFVSNLLGTRWETGADFNGDGLVDIWDLAEVARNLGRQWI